MPSAADTIVAVSSPPGRSLRGLVRISGNRALAAIEAMIELNAPAPDALPDRTLMPARLRLRADGPAALPVLVAVFRGPRSFTGDDMVEIQCPGNPALLERILERACALGARLAEPGEFSFRAFCNRKIDLTQAEGIAATIAATSQAQLDAATHLREGELGRFADTLVEALAHALALVEAGIDFTDEEDVVPIAPAALIDRLTATRAQLDELRNRCRSWASLEGLPTIVLAGAPSTGKSTLFNALLGWRRSVTDSIAGTTRDLISETIELIDETGRRFEATLIDMAGLDHPETALDQQMQKLAHDTIARADVVIHVADEQPGSREFDLSDAFDDRATVRVRSKADLPPEPGQRFDVAVAIDEAGASQTGVEALRSLIAHRVDNASDPFAGRVMALQPRHEHALDAAGAHIDQALSLLEPLRDDHALHGEEVIAGCLRLALDELAALGGRMTPDDVLGKIFSTFCIGK